MLEKIKKHHPRGENITEETEAAALPEEAAADDCEGLPEGESADITEEMQEAEEELPPVKAADSDDGGIKRLKERLSDASLGSIVIIGLILIVVSKIVYDFDGFRGFVTGAGKLIISLLSYLLIGFVIAYVLSAYAGWLQKKPLKKIRSQKLKKALSIILAYVTLFALISFIVGTIVTKVVDSAASLAKMVPNLADKAYSLYLEVINDGRFNLPEFVKEGIVNGIDGAREMLLNLLSADFVTGSLTKFVTATGSGIVMVVMGLLISVYMMIEKDRVVVASKRIVYGLFKPDRANRVVEAGRKVDMICRQYFAGKLLQAFIVMIIAYIVLLIARVEYAILFAAIIGMTNMIPYVGPWIGGAPTILISLVEDPWMGFRAFLCVLAIQAIDNWIVSPRIVGHKMGVSPLLVLAGLCIGGKMFGFIGMVFGDVLAAIVKVFFYDSFIAHRLQKKVDSGLLPEEYSLEAKGGTGITVAAEDAAGGSKKRRRERKKRQKADTAER